MKRFLGLICLLYSFIIIYVWASNNLKNFLAPNMQVYIKISVIPLLIMGLVLLFNNKIEYKFKISDLVLLLPLILIILSSDQRLSFTLSNNKMSNFNIKSNEIVNDEPKENKVEDKKETKEVNTEIKNDKEEENQVYDFSKVDINVVDSSYAELANYITFAPQGVKFLNQKIRVRGFITNEGLPANYLAIGKYEISCCVADAQFVGFFIQTNKEIKINTWYEIEGILEKAKDNSSNDILLIKVINLKEIDEKSEEQYVYPCYAYDNGSCSEVSKYDLIY